MSENPARIRASFAKRQGRQSVATAAAMLAIIVLALLYARPEWLGPNPRREIFSAQIVVIAAFVGFTYQNWRCPACSRHLGGDLYRRTCRRCGVRLN